MKKIFPFLFMSLLLFATPAWAQGHAGDSESECIGVLAIKSKPWSIVTIDGQRVGNTPKSRHLTCGSHKVELVNPAKNKRFAKTVMLLKGKTTEIVMDFNEDISSINSRAVTEDEKTAPKLQMNDNNKSTHQKKDLSNVVPMHLYDSTVTENDNNKSCTIVIKAKPWAVINIDGNRIGNTPQKKDVSCDVHQIELKYPAKNLSVMKTVTLEQIDYLKVSYDFNNENWDIDQKAIVEAKPKANKKSKKSNDVVDSKKGTSKDSSKSSKRKRKDDYSSALPF